ncbi:hypothetical protein [Chitinimonas sp.]|uniref:hypothetical protein n=1 Tax=Chitinimonas sp. TaxID=1934313 RepID=UPI002F93E53D
MLASLIPWPWRCLLCFVLGLACYGTGYLRGRLAEQALTQAEGRLAVVRVLQRERAQQALNQQVAVRHEAGRQADRIIFQTIEKEVDHYVANPMHLATELDAAWLCQHDAAALRTLPNTACQPDAATGQPAGLTSDDALRVAVGNYEICHRHARQLSDLQDWIRAQTDLTLQQEEETP